jgi:hypothetical protein
VYPLSLGGAYALRTIAATSNPVDQSIGSHEYHTSVWFPICITTEEFGMA